MLTWIVCPNLWGARLFCHDDTDIVRFVREFPRPKIHTKFEDFRDDDDVTEIPETIESPELELKVAKKFCRVLSSELERAGQRELFSALIVCAESHFLQIFTPALGSYAKAHLIGTVAQDLYEVNESDLLPYIQEILDQARKQRLKPGAA